MLRGPFCKVLEPIADRYQQADDGVRSLPLPGGQSANAIVGSKEQHATSGNHPSTGKLNCCLSIGEAEREMGLNFKN